MKLLLLALILAPFASAQHLAYDARTGDVQIIAEGQPLWFVLVNSASQSFIPGAARFPSVSDPSLNVSTAQQIATFAIEEGNPNFGDTDLGLVLHSGLTDDFIQGDIFAEVQIAEQPGGGSIPIVTVGTPEPALLLSLAALLLCRRRNTRP
jgi:hypothetical protein